MLAGLLAAGCQQVPCTRAPIATLNLRDEATGLYVLADIDGRPVKLLLDTGSARSVLGSETVGRLGLFTERMLDDSDVLTGFAIEGVGGRRHTDLAWPHRIGLGDAPLLGTPFWVVGSRNTGWDPAGDGILGMDMLGHFDVDLDVGRAKMALYKPGGMCLPEAGLKAALHETWQDMTSNGPRARVIIDGEPFTALIDTGAQQSYILAHAAARLHPLSPPAAAAERFEVTGIGSGHATAIPQDYASVSVGGMVISPHMALVSGSGLQHLDVILGNDVLRHVHAWLSASRHSLTLAEK